MKELKYETIINQEVSKEQNISLLLTSIILLVIGVGLLIIGLLNWIDGEFGLLTILLIVLGTFFITGGSVFLSIVNSGKKYAAAINFKNNYSFKEDHFLIETYNNEEQFGWTKINYADCISFVDRKNYVFINTKFRNCYAVTKDEKLVELLTNKGIKKAK